MWKKRLLQFSLFWLYTVFALVLPCIVLLDTYGMFKEPSPKKITFCLIFVIMLILFYFRKHISKFIDGLTPCLLKSVLVATRELMPLIIVFVAFGGCAYLIEQEAERALFVVKWSAIFNAIGYVIRVVHLWYCDKVKEYYQVTVVQKALK